MALILCSVPGTPSRSSLPNMARMDAAVGAGTTPTAAVLALPLLLMPLGLLSPINL
jgi:hypothetical protein